MNDRGPLASSAVVDGPKTLFSSAFEEYRHRIQGYLLRLTRDPAEAEDLTQETFLRAYRRFGTLREERALLAWLYRIATHAYYDRYRLASYRHRTSGMEAFEDMDVGIPALEPDAVSPYHLLERAEMSECVRNYIEALPDDYRAVVLLHDIHELTNPEIAKMLGCSLETVKIRIHRGRRRLQEALTRACGLEHDERDVLVCQRREAI